MTTMDMKNYIKHFYSFEKIIVYDFKLGDGGIGDYLKFFMIILTHCMNNNKRIYCKFNDLEIQKYIKFKYEFFNITTDEIHKLKNVVVERPQKYYKKDHYNYNVNLNEVFVFDDSVKFNVKYIISKLPKTYISIHLRLGDKFLEVDKQFVYSKNDTREYSEKKLYSFIENNMNTNILFFCDNNAYKWKIKEKYGNILITDSEIGHTSFSNTSKKQILDTITEFYILSNSRSIYAASQSGFSVMASKFNDVEYSIL